MGRIHAFVAREAVAGRQVYILCPLVEESEKLDLTSAMRYTDELKNNILPDLSVALIHGRMKPSEKESIMRDFATGAIQILVSTTVVDVGVNVPNATLMVVRNAERFGLAQLHQLRGRVGRGADQSFCVLMSGDKLSREARARLGAMVETTDGFRLAELDMELRGAGDIAGTQQSGLAVELKIANLGRDARIVEAARAAAIAALDADPQLYRPENRLLAELQKRYAAQNDMDFSHIS